MPQGYVDFITYNAGISSCEKCERWQLTLGLLAKMQTVQVLPNAISPIMLQSMRVKSVSSAIVIRSPSRDAMSKLNSKGHHI